MTPPIGAAASDNGATWDTWACPPGRWARNPQLEGRDFWFAGGDGDFTSSSTGRPTYFYFLFGTYYKDVAQQGFRWPASLRRPRRSGGQGDEMARRRLAVARSARTRHADRARSRRLVQPAARHVLGAVRPLESSPPAVRHPHEPGDRPELETARHLPEPDARYRRPAQLDRAPLPARGNGPDPQVVGADTARLETDREAGQSARLFIHGGYTTLSSLGYSRPSRFRRHRPRPDTRWVPTRRVLCEAIP